LLFFDGVRLLIREEFKVRESSIKYLLCDRRTAGVQGRIVASSLSALFLSII
jgi:hypothetical protein